MFKKFRKDQSGAVIPYILVLAALAVIGSWFYPKYKEDIKYMKDKQINTIEYGLGITKDFMQGRDSGGGSFAAPHENNMEVTVLPFPERTVYSTEDAIRFAYSAKGGSQPYTATWGGDYSSGSKDPNIYGSPVTFAVPGTKSVTVTVTDRSNPMNKTNKTFFVRVVEPITASINAKNAEGNEVNKMIIGETYFLSADVIKFDGKIYTCKWDVDGVKSTTTCDDRLSFSKSTPSTANVSLEVCDNTAKCKTFSKTYTVGYKPLEVEILPFPNRDYIYYYESIKFDSKVTGGSGTYTYEWTNYDSTSASGGFQSYELGVHYIELKVCSDDNGRTVCGTDNMALSVLNMPPNTPTIHVSPNDYPSGSTDVPRGTSFRFTVSGSTDPEGDKVTYRWRVDSGEWSTEPPNGAFEAGKHFIYAQAVDEQNGQSASAVYEFSISNKPPSTPSFSCENINCSASDFGNHSQIYSNSDVTIALKGSTDPENDAFNYEYKLDFGSWQQSVPRYSSGKHTLYGRAIDKYGGTSKEVSFVFEVLNRAPVVTGINLSPANPMSRDVIDFTEVVNEPDGDAYTTYWKLNDLRFSANEPYGNLARGKHEIRAYVVDQGGLVSETFLFPFRVLNSPPSDPTVTISPATGSRYTYFNFSASGSSDFDYDSIKYEYKVDNGTWSTSAPNGIYEPGTHKLYVRVGDGYAYTEAEKSFTVKNEVPAKPTLSISPDGTKSTTTTISFTASSSDGEQDALVYYWKIGDGEWSKTKPNGTFEYGKHMVSVKAYDGYDYSEVTSDTFTIANRTPSKPVITINPDGDLFASNYIDFSATSTDADGDEITYLWKVGSNPWTTTEPDGSFKAGTYTVYSYTKDEHGGESAVVSKEFVVKLDIDEVTVESFETNKKVFTNSGVWITSNLHATKGTYSLRSPTPTDWGTFTQTFNVSIPQNATSSAFAFDYLFRGSGWAGFKVRIDGTDVLYEGSSYSWNSFFHYLEPGSHKIEFIYVTLSTKSLYENATFIDNLRIINKYVSNTGTTTTKKETFDDSTLEFTNSGTWTPSTTSSATASTGTYSFKSGNAGKPNTSSSHKFQIHVSQEVLKARLYFDYMVSSQINGDEIYGYHNGREILRASGNQTWSTKSFDLPSGTNTFEFVYKKDGSVNEREDGAYIDNMILTLTK